MENLTNAQIKAAQLKLKHAEHLQRQAMAENDWVMVWNLQGAIVVISTMLGQEPYVE